MIFNEMNNITVSHENIQESPHELGIGGALMHVYENECNYNALMKAAALSEMKYYNETGGDLFVQEAGALSGFMGKVKEFFKKVIEKIKSIAKKFMAKINQFTMKDKDFVKKYQNELIRRDLKDFEFNGYKFEEKLPEGVIKKDNTITSDVKANGSDDQDAINDIIERNRGSIIKKPALTESEYRDELKELFYGEKGDFPVNIRKELGYISSASGDIKSVEKDEKDIIKTINDMVKGFEKNINTLDKEANNLVASGNDKNAKSKDESIKGINNEIAVAKAYSNDLTVYFGARARAFADRNRQAKAICVKALSYKHESAMVSEGSYGDIFAGVEIV